MTDVEVLLAAVRELSERPTGLPASCNPLLADVFVRWARLGSLKEDLLNRVGGAETIVLARAITGDQQ